jgi:hypothetical protein
MKLIDLYYQGEGFGEIKHLEIEPDATFAVLKSRLSELHGVAPDVSIFLEDENAPIGDDIPLKEHASHKGLKVHIHRCRHVEVTVTFNGVTVERQFSPSSTVARVKRWAAERKFGMSEEDAGEHVLQIAGTHDRPVPNTHIGSLTDGKVCGVAFDLVANERVNGGSGGFA